MTKDPSEQALVEHIHELRHRVLLAVYGILVGTAAAWGFSDYLFDIIRMPILAYLPEKGLVFTGVMDKFTAHLKISVLAGVIVTSPWWLLQVWNFVAPGLYKNERKYAVRFLFSGSMLFVGGICFAYFVVFPSAFEYLLLFGSDVDKPMITIGDYVGFFVTVSAVFGLAFELPVVLVLLGILGIIDKQFLTSKRRYAIVMLAVLSAMVTPPDVISMCFLLAPLYALYEISIILVGIIQKPKKH